MHGDANEPLRQLRRVAQLGVDRFGFTAYRLTGLQHLVNTTFRLDCDTGSYLVRIHRSPQRTLSQIRSELAWLEALAQSDTVPVQAPAQTPSGESVVVIDGDNASYPVSILRWLDGEMLPQSLRSPRHFDLLGRMVAALHCHAQRWVPTPDFDRPVYASGGIEALLDIAAMPPEHRETLVLLHNRLDEVEAELGRSSVCFGLIHADLSFGNVLFDGDEVKFIDFDDCGFGYYLFDLAVILAGPWARPGFAARKQALLAGYSSHCAMDSRHVALLPVLMAARAALLGQWERVGQLLNLPYDLPGEFA